MQRPQFGQRGVTVNGEPVNVAQSVARSVAQSAPRSEEERVGGLKIVGILFITVLFLAWFEALLSGTSLITPINQTLLWGMRGLGLIVGIVVTVLTVLTMTETSLFKRGITVLVCPLLIAFGFGEIAYRISDWTEFGFSSQPFEPAQYPIDSVSHGRKGARNTIRIDPFDTGDSTEIPVTYDQYHDLLKTSADSCVTVMQRKSASGAIEIQTNGRYMLKEPDLVPVGPCGVTAVISKTGSDSASSNPWSKD
ncbi:MAG: hypothetical protein ACKOOL_10385 [Novosphingobium sp.]